MTDGRRATGTRAPAGPFAALTAYELRHLPVHLAAAGRGDDLHRLLSMERDTDDDARLRLDGRSPNAWYSALEATGDQGLYLDHLAIGLRHAAEDTTAALGTPSAGERLARELEYASGMASVHTVSANIPARLLVLMLREGRISHAEAVSYLRQVPDPRRRAEGLTGFLALTDDEDTRLEMAGEALAAVSEIEDEYWRAAELGQLVERLPDELVPEARRIARGFTDPFYEAVADAVTRDELSDDLRRRLASLQFQTEVTTDEYDLTRPEPGFRQQYMAEYLERADHAVAALREPLSEQGPQALDSATWRAEGYAALAERSDRFLGPAVESAGTVGDRGALVSLLRAAAIRLTAAGEAVRAEQLVDDLGCSAQERLTVRCELAAHGLADVAPDELSLLDQPWRRREALRRLLPRWDAPARATVVDEVLRGTTGSTPEWLAVVAPHLGPREWRRAVAITSGLEDDDRAHALAALIPAGARLGLPVGELLTGVTDEFWRARVLDRLTVVLIEEDRWREAVDLARRAPFAHRRAAHLAACATAAGPARGAAVHAEALAVVEGLDEPVARSSALVAVAEVSDGDTAALLDRATDEARTIVARERIRSDTLAAIAVRWAAIGRAGSALQLTAEIRSERSRATALTSVVRWADRAHLQAAVAQARTLSARGERAPTLAAVAARAAAVEPDHGRLHDHVHEAVQGLARGGREQLLPELATLLPAVEALGGPHAVAAAVEAAATSSRWWP